MRSEEAPGAMTPATETPERNLAPEPNEQGFRYILNWMKFILEKPCDRTADESFITEWCDFVYQCQSRLAAAEAELRQIKSSETVAWLMEGSYGKFVYQHNAIADYRELDKNSTVTEIIRRPK